ncbi:MAG TPA: hypothetical protein VNO30_01510 [Kofleriaceae bacterium]|nr:hypothetical protein [Kofleriaceae bacterium]
MSSSEGRPKQPPQPSTRHNPAQPFEWLSPTRPPDNGHERRARVACTELAHRASLLCRLGYTEAEATARLVQRCAWEFEQTSAYSGQGAHRRPEALSDQAIAKIVADAYARRPG